MQQKNKLLEKKIELLENPPECRRMRVQQIMYDVCDDDEDENDSDYEDEGASESNQWQGTGKGRRYSLAVKAAVLQIMADYEGSCSSAPQAVKIVLEGLCGENVLDTDLPHKNSCSRWRGALDYLVKAVNSITWVNMAAATVCRDATSKAGQELVVASLRGNNLFFTTSPWPQATKRRMRHMRAPSTRWTTSTHCMAISTAQQ